MAEITAYIGLGSNLGERESFIRKALAMLGETKGLSINRTSTIVETSPLGGVDQPKYLNAVAEIRTSLDATELLGHLQNIENALGRVRQSAMSSRTIDLDILLFGQEIISKPNLVIPHLRMHLRSFILDALIELNPRLVHPVFNRTIGELALRLNGRDFVINPDVPQLISIAGIIGVGKTTLAKNLAESLGAKLLLEAYDTNPFLAKVYAGNRELALDSELYFLISRIEQIGKGLLSGGQIAVGDYVFDKQKLYAKRLLDPQQQSLYSKINSVFAEKINPPVLLIYLKDTPQNCLDRIRQRNRPYEQRISIEFLQALYDDYEELVGSWTKCPIITLTTSVFDCRDVDKVKELTQEIKAYIAITNETN